MAPLIASALLGRVARVAAVWPLELAGQLGEAADVPGGDAVAVVRAAAAALRGDDLEPLIALVDPGAGPADLAGRLDHVLASLDAVRRALMAVVEAEAADPQVVAALGRQAPTAFALVARRLVRVAAAGGPAATDTAGDAAPDSLGVTVHELRRPLTILASYAQLLQGGGLGAIPESARGAVTSIARATDTMMRLVESLAVVARLGEAPPQPRRRTPVADLVAEAVGEVAAAARLRGLRIEVDVEPGLAVMAERGDLVLALGNLLGNAVKHAPPGSPVRVAARGARGRVRITVTDRGPGFPAADAERLFEKYYRAPGEAERGIAGSGLGLSIVRGVAHRHGGSARARPAPGGGAEFELELPPA